MANPKSVPPKGDGEPKGRARANRPFPSCSYSEAEAFAKAIYDIGSGQPVRRLTLFNEMGKSPESSASREIITNAGKYLLTKGSHKAESLELAPDAVTIFNESTSPRERARVKIRLAIDSIPAFRALYEKTRGLKRPANSVLIDAAREAEVPEPFVSEAVDRFIVNLENVGLIQTLSGAERILEIDHAIDQFSAQPNVAPSLQASPSASQGNLITSEKANFETMCFYITPIGEEGSAIRDHADLFLGSIVEPAVDSLGLTVVRADKIDKPGTITKQVFEYIRKARIVVADLSMHNPNVFYELAVRHMLKKPVVQISQVGDRPPFDVGQMRTIFIDNSSIYKLVPKLETYRSEIANQIRSALENPDGSDNPIAVYYPDVSINGAD